MIPVVQFAIGVALILLSRMLAKAEATLLFHLRRQPENEDSPAIRDIRAFPSAALTALWLCRDALLATGAALGLLLTPHTPWLAGAFVLLIWATAMFERRRNQAEEIRMKGRIWDLIGLLLPLGRALRVIGQDVARQQTSSAESAYAEDEENVAWNHDLEPEERDLMANVRSFGSRSVREVMTPRIDIFSLSLQIPGDRLIQAVDEARFARVPIHRGDDEEIVGILYVKDLLGQKISADFDLETLLHPVEIVAPDMQVDTAFRQLKRRKTHLAMVFDDLGTLIGLVTMEDMLEELFGEIRDEGDPAEIPDYIQSGENLLVSGRLPVQELVELLARPIETEGSSSTVSGLLMEQAGRIPRVGEIVAVDGLRFVVERREGNVLRRVRVETNP